MHARTQAGSFGACRLKHGWAGRAFLPWARTHVRRLPSDTTEARRRRRERPRLPTTRSTDESSSSSSAPSPPVATASKARQCRRRRPRCCGRQTAGRQAPNLGEARPPPPNILHRFFFIKILSWLFLPDSVYIRCCCAGLLSACPCSSRCCRSCSFLVPVLLDWSAFRAGRRRWRTGTRASTGWPSSAAATGAASPPASSPPTPPSCPPSTVTTLPLGL